MKYVYTHIEYVNNIHINDIIYTLDHINTKRPLKALILYYYYEKMMVVIQYKYIIFYSDIQYK